jgi:hypothetical protein
MPKAAETRAILAMQAGEAFTDVMIIGADPLGFAAHAARVRPDNVLRFPYMTASPEPQLLLKVA